MAMLYILDFTRPLHLESSAGVKLRCFEADDRKLLPEGKLGVAVIGNQSGGRPRLVDGEAGAHRWRMH